MTSTEGVSLARTAIENNQEKAATWLVLLDAFLNARGDPMAEVMVRDVKRFLWSLTEDSDLEMERFISEVVSGSRNLAA